MKPRLQARLAAALLCALLAGPCLAQKLTLAVARGTVSLLVYVADQQAYFQAEGLQTKLLECSSGRSCIEQLLKGNADVATAAELPVVLANAGGENLAILASIAATAHQIKLVARASADIRVPADLRGKRIATVTGSSSQYYLAGWLLFHDVDPALVRTVDMEPGAMAGALARREIDAAVIWQPHAAAAAAVLAEDIADLPAPRVYVQQFVLAVRRSRDAAAAAQQAALLRALLKAQSFVAQQPQQARRVLAERLGLTAAQADAVLQEHDFRIRLDQLLLSTMSQQLRWAARPGPVQNPLAWVDAAPLRALAPKAVTLP